LQGAGISPIRLKPNIPGPAYTLLGIPSLQRTHSSLPHSLLHSAIMSLSSPIDFSMRAEDKGLEYFGSPLDDHFNDFFDQYVNEDSLESSDDGKELDFTIDFDNLFDAGTSSSSNGISPNARHKHSSPEPWRKGLWCLTEPVAALPPFHASTTYESQTNGHALVCPAAVEALSLTTSNVGLRPGLPSLEAELGILSTTFPSTPPPTSSRKVAKNIITTPKSIKRRNDANDRRKLLRRSSMSPTLMSQFSKSDVSLDDWTAQRLRNFHLRVPGEELPLTPPPTTEKMQHEMPTRLMVPQPGMQHNGMMRIGDDRHLNSQIPSHHQHQQQHHAVSSPSVNATRNQTSFLAQQAMTTSASLNSPNPNTPSTTEPLMMLSQAHLSHAQGLQPWQSAPLDSSEFGYGASPDLQSTHAETWWQPTSLASAVQPCANGAPAPLPTSASGYYQLAQPTPQRPSHSLVQSDAPSSFSDNGGEGLVQPNGGLMIQYASQAETGANAPPSHYSSSALLPIMADTTSDYPPIPSTEQAFSRASPITPRRRQRTPPSRSPSISPTNTARMASPPMSAHPNSTRSSRRQSHGRRAKSAGTTPKTPQTPGFAADFVNYTPQDSKKILTGVAPSGSSKTKARRELEAREKRRKLSEAAFEAARSGDVEALEAVFC
jgi:hypothetical protein